MKKISVLIVVMLCVGMAAQAMAYFILQKSAPEPAPATAIPVQDVCQYPGVMGAEFINEQGVLAGFGKGVPLRTAVSMILPPKLKGIVAPAIEDQKVSWMGGSSWVSTLDEVARQNSLCIRIRPNDGVVLVDPFLKTVAAPVVQEVQPQEVAPVEPVAVKNEPVQKEELTAPVQQTVEPAVQQALNDIAMSKEFVLHEGAQINDELEKWCKESGWTLFWRPKMSWRVIKTTTIQESDVVAAVGKVIETLRQERKGVRMDVFRGNNVIEIMSTGVSMSAVGK